MKGRASVTRHKTKTAWTGAVSVALALVLAPEAVLGQSGTAGTDAQLPDAQPSSDGEPPDRRADDATWIQLTSGEWLKGEIVQYFRGTLVFDSDKLGKQSISFGDVRTIRSGEPVQVALDGGDVVAGTLSLEESVVRVIGDQEHQFSRSEILSITPGDSVGGWAGSVRLVLSLDIRSGNTDETDFAARTDVERTSPKARFSAGYLGSLSESNGVRTTDSHRATAAWARMLSRRLFWSPLWFDFYRDPFSNIDDRWTLGTGLGYLLWDSGRVDWKVEAGVGYQRTDFDNVAEGEPTSAETGAFLFGTGYDVELTDSLEHSLEYRFSLSGEEAGTYSHHLITGLRVDIAGSLDFDVSLVWDRIEDPRQDADGLFPEKDDLQLLVGLGYSF
jgi:opacity protein-like surface antigen